MARWPARNHVGIREDGGIVYRLGGDVIAQVRPVGVNCRSPAIDGADGLETRLAQSKREPSSATEQVGNGQRPCTHRDRVSEPLPGCPLLPHVVPNPPEFRLMLREPLVPPLPAEGVAALPKGDGGWHALVLSASPGVVQHGWHAHAPRAHGRADVEVVKPSPSAQARTNITHPRPSLSGSLPTDTRNPRSQTHLAPEPPYRT